MAIISSNYSLYLLQQCGSCCDFITYDDVIARQNKQLNVVMENLKFESVQSLSFSVKKVVQQRKFVIDCVPCTGTVHYLTPQLPDGQMSFGVDVSRSKMIRGPAGHLTQLIHL